MDTYTTFKSITEYLESEYSQFEYYFGPIPEDEEIERRATGEASPFFIVRGGKVRAGGRAVAGPRFDEYSDYVDVIAVGSNFDHTAEALSLIIDGLMGFRPTGGGPLRPDGGQNDFAMRNYATRPLIHALSQRFSYQINTSPSRARMAPPPEPEP